VGGGGAGGVTHHELRSAFKYPSAGVAVGTGRAGLSNALTRESLASSRQVDGYGQQAVYLRESGKLRLAAQALRLWAGRVSLAPANDSRYANARLQLHVQIWALEHEERYHGRPDEGMRDVVRMLDAMKGKGSRNGSLPAGLPLAGADNDW
jgi:hypothetical protein